MAVEQLTSGNDDGSQVGRSATEKIGFWGATAVVQQAITAVATATATTTINEARIGRIETALVTLGLITTAG